MVEHLPHFSLLSLAVATRNEYLRTHTEAVTCHKHHHIEHPGKGNRPEFHLADTSHKRRVGDANELLHNEAEEDGVSHLPYTFIPVVCRHCYLSFTSLRRKLLSTTVTELTAIAALAHIGSADL